ncbi:DNA repair protein RadC [Rhodopirellula maiorica SM1]|uniref:DNA repair protein RadC n=1 Tax=Rhodopirellula maiorica SM1 TaxID=1265738 RepID=M5RTH8_9BACT|nr:DNA repair protein RadC [Rhodopirellula maiorica]EMI22600.1 DNA repair protein RadC [Rhodopirellula maiorica SM1]
MSTDRRKRLAQVIEPLTALDEFSSEQAKSVCEPAKPAYVTSTLKTLVREGILQRIVVDDQHRFRWCEPEQFQPEKWIDQQIHGLQVRETPEHERPREKLLRNGAASLSNGDLLAILIRVGVQKQSAIAGGNLLGNRFAMHLEKLPRTDREELREISPTINRVSYAQIMAGIELGRRVAAAQASHRQDEIKITSTESAIQYCANEFARLATDAVQEEFHIVTLDTKHKPIRTHQITIGTLDASLVHPREVFRPAIRDAASAILLVHNHPSGDPTPSREDIQVTSRLTDAGKLLGIIVLDHIIVASQRCLSIREES